MNKYKNQKNGEGLLWKKFPVLDNGFVCLVDWMGDDSSIADSARVSYGSTASTESENAHLIHFLMKHRHTSPFEMAELKFMVRVPMDTWRQWVRHRTASINEKSTRYSVADEVMAKTKPSQWRKQSDTNRQGSGSPIDIDTGETLTDAESKFHDLATNLYVARLSQGVAREQARKDLPLSTYTQAYWKIDLHNLLHFLRLRLAPDAQYEIRQYATAIAGVVEALFPVTWDAFKTYWLNSETFDSDELTVLADMIKHIEKPWFDDLFSESLHRTGLSDVFHDQSRRRREFLAKLQKLGW